MDFGGTKELTVMSSKTYYKCDICGKDILNHNFRVLHMGFITSFDCENLEICEECYTKATEKLGIVPEKKNDKKRFGSILKMWLGR
jgi:hypothetical protein